MIVLNVKYSCKPEKREEFLEAIIAEKLDVDARNEEGNILYNFYVPSISSTDNDNTLLLVEHWKDAEALEIHGRQPHFNRFGELKKEFVEETILEKYITD